MEPAGDRDLERERNPPRRGGICEPVQSGMELPLHLEFDVTIAMLREIDRALVRSGCYDPAIRRGIRRKVARQILLAPVWFMATLGLWSLTVSRMGSVDTGGLALAAIVACIVPVLLLVTESQVQTHRERLLSQVEEDRTRGLACTARHPSEERRTAR